MNSAGASYFVIMSHGRAEGPNVAAELMCDLLWNIYMEPHTAGSGEEDIRVE